MDVEVEEGRDTAEVEDTAETTSMLLSPTAQPRPRTVTCIRQAQAALLFISVERTKNWNKCHFRHYFQCKLVSKSLMRSAPDESSPTRDKGEETVANTRPRY